MTHVLRLLPAHKGKEITGLLPPHEGNGGSGSAPFPAPAASGQDTIKKQLRILVVNDEEPMLRLYTKSVTRAGHSAEQAESGEEALAKYAAAKPNLVLSDFQMPNMNGLELLKKLKEIYPEVNVIIISGGITPDETAACMDAGAKIVFRSPVETATLVAAIERFGF
jgi:DNA-binding NtrC family response regulator